LLKETYGQRYVLNQTSPTFHADLKNLAIDLNATVLLECIGGTMTAELLECLPSGSTAVFYGSMREVALQGFDPLSLIGRDYAIDSFILGRYILSKGNTGILPLIN
jgi:hypothetical protein